MFLCMKHFPTKIGEHDEVFEKHVAGHLGGVDDLKEFREIGYLDAQNGDELVLRLNELRDDA